jgi:hypothetical protein
MRKISDLILTLEEEAMELESVGEYEKAEERRELSLKYKQMEYNGHLTVYDRINKNER